MIVTRGLGKGMYRGAIVAAGLAFVVASAPVEQATAPMVPTWVGLPERGKISRTGLHVCQLSRAAAGVRASPAALATVQTAYLDRVGAGARASPPSVDCATVVPLRRVAAKVAIRTPVVA
jgi:hypothetical protein